jgi:glutathione synthase
MHLPHKKQDQALEPPINPFPEAVTPNRANNNIMSSLTGGSYPPMLDDALERDRLVHTIKDWTIANGLAVRPPPAVAGNDSEGILAMSAPVTLFPSPFPKGCFEEAQAIQTRYNDLYARISRDEEFLSGLVQV